MLTKSALIVVPEIKSTTLKITDKMAGEQLTYQKGAVRKSASVVKSLIDPKQLTDVMSVLTEFRTYVKNNTVPWLGETYLLPRAKFYEFSDKVSQFKDDLEREVSKFLQKYSECVSQARTDLGDLFNASDYPDVFDLRHKFSIGVHFQPVPDNNQYAELGLEEETTERLRAEALEAENELLQKATEDLFKRVQTRLSLLHNRLTDPETKRYRESLVEGLRVLVEVMPDLNITGNRDLEDAMVNIKTMLDSFTLDQVRESEDVRNDVASQVDEIMRKMAGAF